MHARVELDSPAGWTSPALKRLESAGISLFVFAITTAALLNALFITTRLVQNSDTVQSLLAGSAIAHGNLILSGWRLAPDNFYFTDTIPFAAFEFVLGPRPYLLTIVPALTYAVLVLVAMLACIRQSRIFMQNIEACAAISLLLASPHWVGSWDPVLFPDMHLASILGALIAIILCAKLTESNSTKGSTLRQPGIGVLVFLATTATVASDPFSLIFAFGPCVLVLVADVLFEEGRRRSVYSLFYISAGIATGVALPVLFAAIGGFETGNHLLAGFVPAPLLGKNLVAIIFGILNLSGAYPFGLPSWSANGVLALICCVTFAIVVFVICRVAVRLFAAGSMPVFERMLCASILILLLFCAVSEQFSSQVAHGNVWDGGAATRYLIPAVVFAAILGGRQIPELLAELPTPRMQKIVRGALLLFSVIVICIGGWLSGAANVKPGWIYSSASSEAGRWLERHRLTNGVGEYWSASIITAISSEAVRVRPVAPFKGKLVRYGWIEDWHWYATRPQFVIWQEKNQTGVTLANVRASYSDRICGMYNVADYRIAVLKCDNTSVVPSPLSHAKA